MILRVFQHFTQLSPCYLLWHRQLVHWKSVALLHRIEALITGLYFAKRKLRIKLAKNVEGALGQFGQLPVFEKDESDEKNANSCTSHWNNERWLVVNFIDNWDKKGIDSILSELGQRRQGWAECIATQLYKIILGLIIWKRNLISHQTKV